MVLARLKDGASLERASAELNTIARRLAEQHPDLEQDLGFAAARFGDEVIGPVEPLLLVLFGAVGLILLIACANVANLLLARNSSRRQEIAVRLALGAGRSRIVSQLLAESLLLALLGGVLAIGAAQFGIRLTGALAPPTISRLQGLSIDRTVLGFALLVSALTGILVGIIPALRASRPDLVASLKEGTFASRAGFRVFRGQRLESLLAVLQVSMAVVLLVGAGLLLRSLSRLMTVRLGFDPQNLLLVQFSPRTLEQGGKFRPEVLQEVAALPGVESAARGDILVLGEHGGINTWFAFQSRDSGWKVSPFVEMQSVSPTYFRTMRVPILRGRGFTEHDIENAPCVVAVNQSMARLLWPNEDPIGKQIDLDVDQNLKIGKKPFLCDVVGTAGDARDLNLETDPRPEIYFCDLQRGIGQFLIVRTARNPLALASAVLNRAWSVDKNLHVARVLTMDDVIAQALVEPRFRAGLLTLFAALAITLAAVGTYGMIAYSASRRAHEIGIRMALGAGRRDVLRLVIGQAVIVSVTGALAGLLAALALSRFISSLLYGVRTTDAATFMFASALVVASALLAGYIPARRATKVDPMVALRYE